MFCLFLSLNGQRIRVFVTFPTTAVRIFVLLAQTNCPRTNRRASRMCARGCSPETGCDNPTDECVCDLDCGYSCVGKGLYKLIGQSNPER